MPTPLDLIDRAHHGTNPTTNDDDTGANRYQYDTIRTMAMTLRLTDEEKAALRDLAAQEGISMQDAARRAVREYVSRSQHRTRVTAAAERVRAAHSEALERLGE